MMILGWGRCPRSPLGWSSGTCVAPLGGVTLLLTLPLTHPLSLEIVSTTRMPSMGAISLAPLALILPSWQKYCEDIRYQFRMLDTNWNQVIT